MKQAIIYTRFSPRPKATDCLSCEYQLEQCLKYCAYRNLDVLANFEDRALSGKAMMGREGLQDALSKVMSMKEDGILVVYNLSRLARSAMDAITICTRLKRSKADLALVTEQIDTSTPMGRAFFKMMAVFAELTREATSEETSLRLKDMQKKGIRISRITPYGWHEDPLNPKRLKPDPDEQGILDYILKLHTTEQLNPWGIMKALNKRGLKSRSGNSWNHSTVYRILERHVTKDRQILDLPRRH